MVRQRRPRRVRISLEDTKYNILTVARRKLAWGECDMEEDWDICWVDCSINLSRVIRMAPHQKINHFLGMAEICRKKALARNMQTMQALFPKMYNFVPQTFSLPSAMEKALAALKGGRRTFILKPDGGSQGKGIRLVQTADQLRQAIEEMPVSEVVMSRYLHRPLLLRGCKFDLRIYVLVTSCDPLRIWIYEEGLVRLCTQRYQKPSADNLGKRYMHITNFAVNRQNANRVSADGTGVLNDTKWSLSDLRRYMAAAKQPFDPLWQKIRHVIVLSLLGIQPYLKHHYTSARPNQSADESACFELLGYDIMLDDTGRPWLLEVNHSPSFSTEMSVDMAVKEQLMRDTLQMVQPGWACRDCASCPGTPDDHPCTTESVTRSCLSESGAPASGFVRARDAHEAAFCGAYRRVFPSDNTALQDKYDAVLQAAEGAFGMSILARTHKTVAMIQERRRRIIEEEAEREREKEAKALAARARARKQASMKQEPVMQRNRINKKSLSMHCQCLGLQLGETQDPQLLEALQQLGQSYLDGTLNASPLDDDSEPPQEGEEDPLPCLTTQSIPALRLSTLPSRGVVNLEANLFSLPPPCTCGQCSICTLALLPAPGPRVDALTAEAPPSVPSPPCTPRNTKWRSLLPGHETDASGSLVVSGAACAERRPEPARRRRVRASEPGESVAEAYSRLPASMAVNRAELLDSNTRLSLPPLPALSNLPDSGPHRPTDGWMAMGSDGHITNPDRIAKVRILVVGNSGCGKTSLAHLLAQGSPIHSAQQTAGCNTFVKEVESAVPDRTSYGDERSALHFVEFWDIGAHDRYKDLRHLFYANINGVLLVHDATMSPARARGNIEMWAREVAKAASFSAPFAPEAASSQPGGLPVPCLIVANKTDLQRSARQSGGRLDVGGWQQLWASWWGRMLGDSSGASDLSPARSGFPDTLAPLPTTLTSAKRGDFDPHTFHQFFLQCIHSRYSPSDQTLDGIGPTRKEGRSDSGPASWWSGAHSVQGFQHDRIDDD
ncbi:hypothetical protein WJX73_005373 [Symbiochloris irregularis]|uniref:Uncharacterized protein n=1 Tax=Symbiochloris irregularis TaxID=706552 RepID=A0AAW1NM75_9CHLO